MFNKKIFMLSILFICLLSISSVSAIDSSEGDIVGIVDTNNDFESVGENLLLGQTQGDEVLSLGNAPFAELANKIANANESSTITLDDDYLYTDEFGNKEGILINKSLTIDGGGHTIDGGGASRIFNVLNDGVVLKNIVFMNARAEGNGGAVCGNCIVTDCTFQQNYVTGDGGALFGGSAVNCIFIGNCAENHGGAIFNSNATNCNFNNNSARLGGSIYADNAQQFVMDCSFKSNSAYQGGAIYSENNHYSVSNSYFSENKARQGGAVFNVTAMNCIFENNGAVEYDDEDDGDGGAMRSGIAINCTFTGNYADDDGDGGALSHAYAENCNFVKNWVDDEGGAIYYSNAVNCNFTDNYADDEGGAIYSADALNCTFINNRAGGSDENHEKGGAIYNGNAENCTFTGNFADSGGAMYGEEQPDSSFHAYGCTFIGNSADAGGALYRIYAVNCIFTNNTSTDDGGAMYYETAKGCIFTGNFAADDGGAIYDGRAKGCTFVGNSADSGGAGHTCDSEDCTFILNHATDGSGGAIYEGYAINCNFTNNSASENGGAIFNSGAEECTFTGNTAINGGAISGKNGEEEIPYVNGSFFIENHAENGGAVCSVYAFNCTFIRNTASSGVGNTFSSSKRLLCQIYWNGGNEDKDTEILIPNIVLGNGTNFYNGDMLPFDIVYDGKNYDGYVIDIHVTGADAYDEYFQGISGSGWFVDLPEGNYTVTFYSNSMVEIPAVQWSIQVNASIHITANDISTAYQLEEFYVVNFTDRFNRPVSGAEALIDFNGVKNYTADENGQIILSTIDLTPGTYVTRVDFFNKTYGSASISNVIFVDKQHIIFIPGTLVTTFNASDELIVTLQDIKYNPISGVSLSVDLGGTKNYTTDKNGEIKVSTKDLTPDTYYVNVAFSGNDMYHPVETTAKVVVNKGFSKLVATSLVTTYNSSDEFIITLNNDYNNPISGALIFVDLNGTKNYTTNRMGQIKISIDGLIPDTYSANVTFNGNGLYQKSNTITHVVIEKIDTKINSIDINKNYQLPKEFIFDLKDEQGNPARNVSVVIDLNGPQTYTTDENGQIKIYIYNNEKLLITLTDTLGNPVKNELLCVELNGAKNYTTDEEGQISVSTDDLTPGVYIVNITFYGNEIYRQSTGSSKITIEKSITKLTVNNVTTTYGVENDLVITLDDSTGNPIRNASVWVDLNGVKEYTTDENGQIIIPAHNLTPGAYVAKISFEGDKSCMGSEADASIIVNKIVSRLTANIVSTTYGVENDLVITLDGSSGNPIRNASVWVDLNGVKEYTTDENGQIIISTNNLIPATYVAKIRFSGDEYYLGSETETLVVFNKIFTKLTADNVTVTYGDNKNLIITLEDVYSNPVSDAYVSVDLNGVNNYVTDVKGQIIVPLQNLTPGSYVAKVGFSGDDYYMESKNNVSVFVMKITPVIILNSGAGDIVKYYHGSERLYIALKDAKGNPLSGSLIHILINNVRYDRTTDDKGEASIALNMHSGNYSVFVSFGGDKIYKSSNATVDAVIKSTIIANDLTKIEKGPEPYVARFLDSEGKSLDDGTTVQFNINGMLYKRVIKDGIGKLNINLAAGNYVITAINPSNGESSSNNITVLSRLVENRDIIKYFKNGTQYTVKVLDDNGKPMGAGKNVTFNINGVFYTRQTNGSGIAKLNINLEPGNYIITAEYDKCKVSNKIRVLPVLNASDITMKYRDGTQFKVNLVDGQGNPYANITVTFNINGVFYARMTDSNGQAKLNINLMAGEYIITSSYNGSSIANKITIKS